uniref:Uncharacterized protein n=1 Tax=Anguilla anguilla TaxID=7936 RepID=A0A0E9SJ44_ANGAN
MWINPTFYKPTFHVSCLKPVINGSLSPATKPHPPPF